MNIIKCEECEKMIDSDLVEIESVGDKEYCQECFQKLALEIHESFTKGFVKYVNDTAKLFIEGEKKDVTQTLADNMAKNIYSRLINHDFNLGSMVKELFQEPEMKACIDKISKENKENEALENMIRLKDSKHESLRKIGQSAQKLQDERKIKEGEMIIKIPDIAVTTEEAFKNLKSFMKDKQ